MTSARVSGHTLRNEGAAFANGHPPNQRFPIRIVWSSTSGIGYGLCSCGARSPIFASATKRKAWHRTHKAEVSR